jgi:hypothetical protein
MPSNPLPYRVVQWSTGTIGALALRAIIEHPHAVNAVPYVCAATPGIPTSVDLLQVVAALE